MLKELKDEKRAYNLFYVDEDFYRYWQRRFNNTLLELEEYFWNRFGTDIRFNKEDIELLKSTHNEIQNNKDDDEKLITIIKTFCKEFCKLNKFNFIDI